MEVSMTWQRLGVCTLLAIAPVGIGACSSDSSDTTVDVTEADFSLKPSVSRVAAGTVKFKVKNNGTFDPSALVVTVNSSTWSPGDPVTVTSKYQASVSILGVTLFSDKLTTRRTARVLD